MSVSMRSTKGSDPTALGFKRLPRLTDFCLEGYSIRIETEGSKSSRTWMIASAMIMKEIITLSKTASA